MVLKKHFTTQFQRAYLFVLFKCIVLLQLLQYNVPNGKKNRGLATVLAYKMLEKKENLTPENIHLANMMGWSVEMVSFKKDISS